ncbi:M16 family metallopeptidase [Myroides pelagicus]|uniref:Insulinase family protein n=1 Tax=Myroides pelagicus TaxID=270914 RepID=A0A7K1GJL6_9FLAO|nr:pitrilysin family protein [Myroides pelagicus]MEC4112803.1 pitrilysin family protein [Myroides pelagicus]MTH28613.1 insulinase family protein [Myroides pelagicus]
MKKVYIYAASLAIAFTAMQGYAQDRKQPIPGPAPTINVSEPTSFVLKNGLKVMVVKNSKLPQVSYMLTIDNPIVFEGEKAGMSSLVSGLMGTETKTKKKDVYNEEIDFLGASIRFHAGGAYGSGLSKYNTEILSLLADGALNSVFTQEEFDKVKTQTLESLKVNEKSVTAVARRVENALLYGKNTAAGEFETVESIEKITLKDVNDYYAKYFTPTNAYLVIVGDVDVKETEKLVKKYFNAWKGSNASFAPVSVKGNVNSMEIDFVNMPNAVQSEIALVNEVDLKMNDKDYFAALMANQILGGGGEGRLFLNLREAHGWTYGAYSALTTSRKYPGKFKATASVRNAVTDSAVTEFVKEIDLMRNTLVKAEELKMAKAKYVGNFVMSIQKPETVARFALNKQLHKLPNDFYESYIKNINAVTAEDVQRVAKKYFLKDNMRVVIVGKGSEVGKQIEQLGLPINYFNTFADPIEKPVFEKSVPEGVTVQSVLNKYIDAIGGEAKLKGIKSVEVTSSATVQGMTLESVTKVKDGYLSLEQKMMGSVVSKQIVTPTEAFVMAQGQKIAMEGDVLAEAKESAFIFPELNWVKDLSSFSIQGIETIDGKDAVGIKKGNSVHYYAVDSGLKLATKVTREQMGQVMVQATTYQDYKTVDGVKFSFKQLINVGVEFENVVNDIVINKAFTDSDFQ